MRQTTRTTRTSSAILVALAIIAGLAAWSAPGAHAAPKDPVIIVAGTFSPSIANEPLRARLRADGYDTYIFQLPGLGLGDIAQTSQPLVAYVNDVLARTGASRVDLVGHSQGALVSRYYVRNLGGSAKVDSVISLGGPHYGTSVANIGTILGFGSCIGIVACQQMAIGSTFLNNLNAGDDTVGTVQYTNLYTTYDELVRPVANATLKDGATNVKVQSQCWLRVVGHLGLILDGTVYSGVQDALEHRPITLNCFAV